jgi:hypothetical protein
MKQRLEAGYSNKGAGVAGLNKYTDNEGADVVGLTNKQIESFVKNFTDKKEQIQQYQNKMLNMLNMFYLCLMNIINQLKNSNSEESENAELKEYFKNLYEEFYTSYFDLMLKFNFSESHKEILYKKKLEIDGYYNQNKTNEKSKNSFIKNAVNKIKVDY